jgi:hypothetical protein
MNSRCYSLDGGNMKVMYFLDLLFVRRSEFKLTIGEYRSGHLKAYRTATSCATRTVSSAIP